MAIKLNPMTSMKFPVLRKISYIILVISSVMMVFPMLILAYLSSLYDLKFNLIFGERIRSIVSRKVGFWLVPLLPFYVMTWSYLELTNTFAGFLWFLMGIVLVEVHSVCLHRESWIAAFEPQWIPQDALTLGGKPIRPADRRLHHLLFIIVTYAIPLIIIGVLIPARFSFQSMTTVLFIIRYFEYARIDFETCIHWNMHCDVLKIEGKPYLTRFWEVMMDYLVGPLSGYVPRVYNANHLLLHHWLNANPRDIHSTTAFRRSSFLEFCFFAMKLSGSIMFATDLAFHKKCRGKQRIFLLMNLLGFWSFVGILLFFGRILGPLLILFTLHHGVIMARFQYVWHGLIHPNDPNPTLSTTTLWISSKQFWSDLIAGQPTSHDDEEIPLPGTDWPFFDNYHLLHHLKPNAHFTQYQDLLRRYAPQLVQAQCAVLTLDVIATFPFDCWTLNIDRIANALQIDLTNEEKHRFIRTRLEPVKEIRHPIGTVCESSTARHIELKLLKLLELITGGE